MDEIKLDVEEQGKVGRAGSSKSDQVMKTAIVRKFRQERFRSVWTSILLSPVESQWTF